MFFKILSNQRGEVNLGSSDSGSSDSGSSESSAVESSAESSETIEASAEDGAVLESSDESSESESSELPSGEESLEVSANNEQELEQEIQEAIEEGASEEQVKDMIRKFTLKVNGKEITREIDLSDEEALKKELQLSHAGRQAMQELAEIKKVYTSEIRRLMDNPFQVMSEIDPNFDPMSLVKDYVETEYQKSQLTPEQKAAQEKEAEYKRLQEENQKLRQIAADQKRQEELDALEAEIESDIIEAIENDSELNLDEDTVALVVEELIWADENGFSDFKAKDVLGTVKDRIKDQFRSARSKFKSTAAMKEYMGEELLDLLREERIKQAKEAQTIKNVSSIKNADVAPPAEKEEKEEQKIKLSTLFR